MTLHEHKQLEYVWQNQTFVALVERECPNHIDAHVSIDCDLAEGDAESTRPELPLNLLDHLRGCALVLLLFSLLFSKQGGSASVGLGVYGLLLLSILLFDLLLMTCFSHLPLWRR